MQPLEFNSQAVLNVSFRSQALHDAFRNSPVGSSNSLSLRSDDWWRCAAAINSLSLVACGEFPMNVQITSHSEYVWCKFSIEPFGVSFFGAVIKLFCRLVMSLIDAPWCPNIAWSWWNFVLWFVDVFWHFSIICNAQIQIYYYSAHWDGRCSLYLLRTIVRYCLLCQKSEFFRIIIITTVYLIIVVFVLV